MHQQTDQKRTSWGCGIRASMHWCPWTVELGPESPSQNCSNLPYDHPVLEAFSAQLPIRPTPISPQIVIQLAAAQSILAVTWLDFRENSLRNTPYTVMGSKFADSFKVTSDKV
ncbi:hypothetical protein ACJ73_09611 [Blastomyces percursus]|uniref:Uncharacterized protein n=1 Tax=Blastomyces percursus TaxID=1658174 RepID=A0A1J9P4P8_9EURO|nr:hypothetical protein ACJ73_09611 [Blastomyces percursus]